MSGTEKRRRGSVAFCIRLKDGEDIKQEARRKGLRPNDLLKQFIALGRAAHEEGVVDVRELVLRLHADMDEFAEMLQLLRDQVAAGREESQAAGESLSKHLVESLMILRVMAHRMDPRLLQDAQNNARSALHQALQSRSRADAQESAAVGG